MRALLLVPLLLSLASAEPTRLSTKIAPSPQLKLFSLTYRADEGVTGEVRINDVPIITLSGKGSSGSSAEVQCFLRAGINTVEVRLQKAPAAPDDETATVSLHGLTEPGFPDHKNALFQIVLGKTTKPGTLTYSFELPEKQAPPSQLWTRAAVVPSLTEADKKELRALATAMLDAIKKGDVAAGRKIWTYAMEERARSTYADPKEMVGQIDQMIPAMKSAFAKGVVAAQLDFALVGRGRIVRVTSAGGPPITTGDPDSGAAIPLHAAKLDGKWTLVP
jgi:hypothetical protein